ncbi:MAG TPA: glycerophosphodiester phosphodiesterase family protein [Elusimicrobiota bacterium]|nr:glycerophosphodiester phosphodiesterase family protein [Elusimicrobiota bacterium]
MRARSIQKSPFVIGHRGAMGYAPENTLASYTLAWKMGVDAVECDVHLSRDGRIVVMHDETLDRTTNGTGPIQRASWKKIMRLDAGSWFHPRYRRERVLPLGRLLRWVRGKRTKAARPLSLVIEIKNEKVKYRGIAEKVVRAVEKEGMTDRVILISFDHAVVRRIKQIQPRLMTGILYYKAMRDPVSHARRYLADALFPRRHLVTRSLLKKARQEGLVVATWTVNERSDMKKMIAAHVDGIASNYPDRLLSLLKR